MEACSGGLGEAAGPWGWTAEIFGFALLLYAWIFSGAAHTAVLPDQAESVGDRFISHLLGPTWTVGRLTLLYGGGLYTGRRLAES